MEIEKNEKKVIKSNFLFLKLKKKKKTETKSELS